MSCNLSYVLSLTGDCSNTNSGAFDIQIYGSAPDYTIQWLSPAAFGTIVLGEGVTGYTVTDLSASTYTFTIIDSCSPENNSYPVNVYISSGTCVSIGDFENTLCGLDNGSISAVTSNSYGLSSFYLYDSVNGYITSATSVTNDYQFTNLSASTYYVVADDGGGCTGQSESIIIQDSSTVSYGLYVVNDAGCAVNSGKIFVTGLTGNPPYTYLWSNGQTTSSITGLTTGGYSVTVTDNTGCEVSQSVFVNQVPPIGIAAIFTTGPSCFESNGEVTVVITGGTGPYYYSGSTSSNNGPSFDTEYTFTNLGSGNFNIRITDAGLCNTISSVFLTTPGGFSVVSITTTNSTCSDNDGTLAINLFGGSAPYVYTLAKAGGSTVSQTSPSSTWSFNDLSSGTYTLTIDDGGPCTYTNTYVINNIPAFTLSTTTTGTTCNNDNGIVTVTVSGGSPTFTYVLDDGATLETTLSSTTFNSLTSGPHSINVTDGSNCSQTITFNVAPSTNVDFILSSTDAIVGNNGTITALITNGQPPFTLTWSTNVNGQTGMTVNSLSAGTYNLLIVDDNGCERTKTVSIGGNVEISSYQVYSVCDSDLFNYGQLLTKGPKQMLLEGFNELTLNEFNCVLNQSIFEASVTVSGVTTAQEFYTGTTLNEYPTVNEWNDVIESMLLSYDGIASVTFNVDENKMTITTDCNSIVSLNDADVVINMVIYYDISCESCTGCYTPEFEPINCEITNEYCETTDTKVIYPITWNFFGADYLNDTDIIPNRCTELPFYNPNDCQDVFSGVEVQFREIRDSYMKYQNVYNILLVGGRITDAENLPVVLPPSAAELDFFYYGQNNVGWHKFNVLQGCSCKKIAADNGQFGPQYDFDIVYLPEVQSYIDLPLTGEFAQLCYVMDDEVFYTWDPNSSTWVLEGTPIVGYPDIEDCAATQRAQRDAYLKALNQLILAWRPFTWSTFHAPLYQIFKYNF